MLQRPLMFWILTLLGFVLLLWLLSDILLPNLLGFVGLLIAVPLAAAIAVLCRFGLRRYMASPIYQGDESG